MSQEKNFFDRHWPGAAIWTGYAALLIDALLTFGSVVEPDYTVAQSVEALIIAVGGAALIAIGAVNDFSN